MRPKSWIWDAIHCKSGISKLFRTEYHNAYMFKSDRGLTALMLMDISFYFGDVDPIIAITKLATNTNKSTTNRTRMTVRTFLVIPSNKTCKDDKVKYEPGSTHMDELIVRRRTGVTALQFCSHPFHHFLPPLGTDLHRFLR